MKIREGKGHWMDLEDKVALPWMAKFTRNPCPRKWSGSRRAHPTNAPTGWPCRSRKRDSLVVARRHGQTVEILAREKVKACL